MFNKNRNVTIIRIAACLLIQCVFFAAGAKEIIETTVAVVNDSVLVLSQLQDHIRREAYLRGILPAPISSETRKRILEEFIEDELLFQEAQRKKIQAPAETIDNMTDRFVLQVEGLFSSYAEYLKYIDIEFIDLPDFKRRARAMEEREYLINTLVSMNIALQEKDVLTFAEQLKNEGKATTYYRLSQIFFRFPENANNDDKEAVSEKALEVLMKIHNGADSAKMAREVSQDEASRKRGGELGVMEQGKFAKIFEEAASKLKEGEVSLPIASEHGIHLIRLDEKVDARRLLFQKRFKEERAKIIYELKQKAFIRKLEDNL